MQNCALIYLFFHINFNSMSCVDFITGRSVSLLVTIKLAAFKADTNAEQLFCKNA
jgi:patatin-like phospholipase/acyl hydrolase